MRKSSRTNEPTEAERVANELRWQQRYRGLDPEGVDERAKQLIKQGARPPRFEKAPE